MALAVLTLSCLLLYKTSKYYPGKSWAIIEDRKTGVLMMASALLLLSLYLFTFDYDLATSLVFWMIALVTILSAMILTLKLSFKWIWVWGGLFIVFLMVDFS